MLDHISLGVENLQRSMRFYDAVLGTLGHVRLWSDDDAAGYGPPDGTDEQFAIKQQRSGAIAPPDRLHIAFQAGDRASVKDFYACAMANGAVDNGAPKVHEEYGRGYFAAFVIDLDGYPLEAVYHEATV